MSSQPDNEPARSSATSSDDEEWPEEIRPDVEAGRRVSTQLKSDATLVTAQLRDAWSAVCVLPTHDAGEPGVDDTLDAFAMVVKDIYRAFDICQSEKRHKLSLDAWSRMYDAGLPDLVQDIVMQPRFWTLPRPSVIGHLFDTQMQIAYFSYHSYQSFCPRVLSRADALWTAMWKNRQLIADWSTDRPAKHSLREHPVIQALVIYYVLHRHGEALVTLSSHMPHFSLYAWTVAEFQTEHFRSVYLCGDALRGPSYDPSIFVREAIINGVGVDACFTRLAEVLRGEDPWHWDSLGDLKESLHIFSGLLHGNTPETMTFVIGAGHHRIPSLAATIAKKHALAGGLRANPRFYNSTFSLIIKTTEYDCFMRSSPDPQQSLLVPGEDVVAILACAIDLLAVHGNEFSLSDNARAAFGTVKGCLLAFMQVYYDWAKKIKEKAPGIASALETDLLAGMRRGAQEHWWHSLRALNAAKRRCETRNEDFVRFGTLWKGFGALLGCDAKRERERDASEAAGRCTRLECEYHRKPTGKQLSRCKGCGVYYCSRECQVADWKSGHKKACGRMIRDGEAD